MKFKLNNIKAVSIVFGILIVMCIIVFFVISHIYNNEDSTFGDDEYENYSRVVEALNTHNIRKSKLKKSKAKLASKYDLGDANIRESKKDFLFNDVSGKVIYVRSNKLNLNVFQGIYEISDGAGSPLIQVREYINKFKDGLYTIGELSPDTEPTEEKLYGESQYWFKIPIEESIYVEKRLYSLSYTIDASDMDNRIIDNTGYDTQTKFVYELNFYMDGNKLVCELVNNLSN